MEWRSCVVASAVVALICLCLKVQSQADFTDEEMNIVEAKCELCKTAVNILHKEIEQTSPSKKLTVGSFRMNADGSTSQRQIPYRGSELHLQDLLDDNLVCGKMKDIVPVTDKETGNLWMLNMLEDMSRMSEVKFFPNPDMNSRMDHLCQEMFGHHEEDLLEIFRKQGEKTKTPYELGKAFCHETIHYCPIIEKLDSLKTAEDKIEKPDKEDGDREPPSFNDYDAHGEL